METVKSGNTPKEDEISKLIDEAIPIFNSEKNVLHLNSPLKICGDSHGQLYDTFHMLELSPPIPETKYLFLGDYVDRGAYSLELLCLFLVYKVKYPDSIYLLRGNHETSGVNSEYGFIDEMKEKFKNTNLYNKCNELFKYLPIAAIVEDRIFCVHGGLAPMLETVDQLDQLERRVEPELTSLLCNILWSDPSEVSQWMRSERRSGYLFGEEQTETFLKNNNLEYMVRSHEMVDGYRLQFNGKIATVWNAPNYCYVCGNKGSFLLVGKTREEDQFVVFNAMPEDRRKKPSCSGSPYFM